MPDRLLRVAAFLYAAAFMPRSLAAAYLRATEEPSDA